MSSLAFVTHHSVRIKGTENAYTPTQCLDERCPVKAPHMHCPLCVKSDVYQDPVILKAHYRVKHVDKAIEFAGLKILRCCDQCDIIGIIKGEKRFKGAHWHCYRCRNGFNRRDEAIKHYKTHFRNPQTTFQIQITQDLNSPPDPRQAQLNRGQAIPDAFASNPTQLQAIMRPPLTHHTLHVTDQNGASVGHHGMTMSRVKPEPLDKDGTGEQDETIMIIQGTQLESALASHIIDAGDYGEMVKNEMDPNVSWETRFRLEEEAKNIYKARAEDYKLQIDALKQQVANLESQLDQQRQLSLHEVVQLMGSPDLSQRLAANEQFSKFLEQFQTFLPSSGCLTFGAREVTDETVEVESVGGKQHGSRQISEIIHDFEDAANGCNTQVASTSGLASQGHQKLQACGELEVDDDGALHQSVPHSIADQLQVLCAGADVSGKVLLAAPSVANGSIMARPEFVSAGASTLSSTVVHHSAQGGSNQTSIHVLPPFLQQTSEQNLHHHHNHSAEMTIADALADSDQDQPEALALQDIHQQIQLQSDHHHHHQSQQGGISMQDMLPEMGITHPASHHHHQGGLAGGADVEDCDEDETEMLAGGCLMEVVAANGLASLGQDSSVVSTSSGGGARSVKAAVASASQSQTFMMIMPGGQQVLVQPTNAERHQSQDEPQEKRLKL